MLGHLGAVPEREIVKDEGSLLNVQKKRGLVESRNDVQPETPLENKASKGLFKRNDEKKVPQINN